MVKTLKYNEFIVLLDGTTLENLFMGEARGNKISNDRIELALRLDQNQGPYSPTILENILGLVLEIFLNLEAFECYTTSDWLNHTV